MDTTAKDPGTPIQSAPKKVSSACQRCRRQKLKCDVQRPCTLCFRAGVDCLSSKVRSNIWKIRGPDQIAKRTPQSGNRTSVNNRPTKRTRRTVAAKAKPRSNLTAEAVVVAQTDSPRSVEDDAIPATSLQADGGGKLPLLEANTSWPSTSATMTFVEEAFHQHDTTTPAGPETSAFTASQWMQSRSSRLRALNPAEIELLSLLPEQRSAELLVNNYFARIHWFILVFHQSEFKTRFRQLYNAKGHQAADNGSRLGFISVFLAVCLVSLRYTNAEQTQKLRGYGVEPVAFQQRLLDALRLRLLDIVSLGSIEAVQTCVLLGSFYLYHGMPELAWPVCGLGLRIAQALKLYRRSRSSDSGVPDLDDPVQRAEENQKRCWWAVYEIETVCSMLYGFPLSITDGDCDVELLNPYALRSRHTSSSSTRCQAAGQATLLSYKHFMARLSIIIKSALTDLYGLHQKRSDQEDSAAERGSHLRDLIPKVADLDTRLRAWYQSLPKQLHSSVGMDSDSEESLLIVSESTTDFPDENTQRHLFRLQALALKLAFENARILVHRPLLSYRTVECSTSSAGALISPYPQSPDPFQFSVHACRDAALQISQIGSVPTFKEAADSYAVPFVSLNIFTAGVTLSIMTSLQPLSRESYESKAGIRRLLEMQYQLKSKSIVAKQGFDILKQLMLLVMSKEKDKMFDFEVRSNTAEQQAVPQQTLLISEKDDNTMAAEEPHSDNAQEDVATGNSSAKADSLLRSAEETELSARLETTPALGFDFYEDPAMSQALLEIEQAMNDAPNRNVGEGDLLFGEYLTESCFNSQDQGWMWGSNYRI